MKKTTYTTASTLLATMGAANAAVVFIDLPENIVRSTNTAAEANSFNFDDVTFVGNFTGAANNGASVDSAMLNYNTNQVAQAYRYSSLASSFSATAGDPASIGNNGTGVSVSGFISVQFTTANFNNGQTTNGLLELSATSNDSTVQASILNLYFDDENPNASRSEIEPGVDSANEYQPTPVPEPSSLALLALGATGLLARRRRTAA